MRKISLIILIICFSLLTFPINSNGEEDQSHNLIESEYFEQDKRLQVGVIPDSPPFQYIEDGNLVGFNIDAMDYISEEQNIDIRYIPMTRKKGIKAIQDGTIDILLGIPFAEEYSQEMEFTDAFITSSIGVLVPNDSDINNLSDLQEKVVALQLNTLEYNFIKNIRNVHVHVAHSQTVAVQIMLKERADAFIGNHLTIEYLLDKNNLKSEFNFIETYLLPLDFSFVVQKEDYTLLNRLNIGIRHFKLSNEYAKIYSKWFGDLETPLHKRFKTIRDTLIIIVAISAVIFWLGLRWNRELQKQVNKKTKDLQVMNESLKIQMRKAEESDQIKEQILESSIRGVITVNKVGVVLTINTVACQLFNVNKDVVGKHIKHVLFEWKRFEKEINDVISEKRVYRNEELNVSDYYETIEFISYDIQPFYSATNDVIGTLLYFEDVTEQIKLKDQLYIQEKSRALIQLVAGVAHEIRNPLTSIKAFVEMIPIKMNSKKFRDEISFHVPKEIDRLNELVEELINYAKPKSDNKKLIDLSSSVNFVVLLFKNKINNKGYHLVTEVEEDVFIMGDENQIKQVLINIVLNAIESNNNKYEEKGKTLSIYIRLYTKKDEVVIEIEDEGIGMSKEMVDRVFEPFYTTKSDGTGLGLALSRQFIVENNGNIHVESELGQYSKFKIHFPIEGITNAKSINN